MRFGIIYKITNVKNGVSYIGKTINSLEKRKENHCYNHRKKRHKNNKLYNAFRKYGLKSFKWEILQDNIPEDDLDWYESWFIVTFDTKVNGYNSTNGGVEEKNLKSKLGRTVWNKGLKGDIRLIKAARKAAQTRKKNYVSLPVNKNITYKALHECIIDKQMTRQQAAEFLGTNERLIKKWKQKWRIKSTNDGRIKPGQHLSPNTEFKAYL